MTLGQNIQTARRAKGLSQEALAERIGVSRQALGKWEKDTALPGLDNLRALAETLDVSVDGLLGRAAGENALPGPALTLDEIRTLLDARDAAQQTARRRTGALLGALALTFLLLAGAMLLHYKGQLDAANTQLRGLQAQVGDTQATMRALSDQMQELQTAVRRGESSVAAWSWKPVGTLQKDETGWWYAVEVSVTPRDMTEGLGARLLMETDRLTDGEMTFDSAAGRFTLRTAFVVGTQPSVSVRWLAADGTAVTEILGTVDFRHEQALPQFTWIHSNEMSFQYRVTPGLGDREGSLSLCSYPAEVELRLPDWLTVQDAWMELYITDSRAPAASAPLLTDSGGYAIATFDYEQAPWPYAGGGVWMEAVITDQNGDTWRSDKMWLSERS